MYKKAWYTCSVVVSLTKPIAFWELKWPQEKLKTMLMQNFGVTNKEHYGILWYFLEWPIALPFLSSKKTLKFGHFMSWSYSGGREMYKKAWCTCSIVVLPTKPIAFWRCHRRRRGGKHRATNFNFSFLTWIHSRRIYEFLGWIFLHLVF